jgi:transcriptional regulator GlxA family with amidase domain
MAMSRAQIHRKISALTDRSTSLYIRSIRLQHGKKLLQTTDLKVSEVAYRVGFDDPKYFSRVFQEEFQMAPSEVKGMQG